jgi:membrane-associated phospholipid phosphatase
MTGWMTITRLGDIAVTAPVALAIAALPLLDGERRTSIRWAALFAAGSMLVVATKIAFIGWGIGLSELDFTGASGHAMRAAAIAPVLPHLLCRPVPSHPRLAWMALGCVFAALIGISRIVLHFHSVSEVVAGWLIGLMVGICFIRLSGDLRKPAWNPRIAAGMAVLIAAAFLARPAPTQHWLIRASLYMSGRDKPFAKPLWKAAPTCPQAASAFSSNWCSAAKSGSPT